ncbi:hypothetical protein ACTXT7_002003 [Hymenolepis weldensis]
MDLILSPLQCRVILADVTKTKAPMWCPLMTVYGLVVFVICVGLPRTASAQIEFPCLFGLTSYLTVMHLIFARDVTAPVRHTYLVVPFLSVRPEKAVHEMCALFKIRAFHVDPVVVADGKNRTK